MTEASPPAPRVRWYRRRWALIAGAALLFLVGVGIGAAGGTTTETVTESATLTVTETAEATTVTDVETVTRTELRSPPNRGVKVSYGEWPNLFRISGAHVVNDFEDHAIVLGQFTYLGGGDCPLGYVAVQGTFFDEGGNVVGTGLWNSNTAPEGVGLPMEVSGSAETRVARAEIVVTSADCKS